MALLAPWWLLPAAVALVFAAIRLLPVGPHERAPLFGSAVAILPWLPFPVPPAFLIWTGPFVLAVWVAVLLGILSARAPRNVPWLFDPRRAPIAAAIISLCLYGGGALWLAPILPDGDEPHYLILAQSLIKDGDLKIENNHKNGDYLSYSLNAAAPDYLRRGTNGEIYSIHAPGLPVLIAPAMWLFGYSGVVGFLAVIAAVSSALVWWFSYRVTNSRPAAWFGWSCCAVTTPFFFQATEVFPDGIAATCLLVGTMPLWAPADSGARPTWNWIVAGLSLAVLPWLQTRLAVLAIAAAFCVWLRTRDTRQRLAFAALPALAGAAWFGFFIVVYGTPNPTAPYGGYTQTGLANLLRGIPGLLFDQQFGLIANAPVYGIVLAGVIGAALKLRRWAWETLALTVPYMMAVGSYQMWWGGTSVPARLLTPITLILGIAGARVWHQLRAAATRTMAAALLLVSILIALTLLVPEHGRLLLNFRDGISLWLEWANDVVDLPKGLPSLFRDSRATLSLKVVIWLLCGIGAWLAQRTTQSRREQESSKSTLSWPSIWTGAVAVMVAFTLSWRMDNVEAITPESAKLNLVGHATAIHQQAYDFSSHRFEGTAEALTRLRVNTDRQRRPVVSPILFGARNVPAGTYRLEGTVTGPPQGILTVHVGSQVPLLNVSTSLLIAGEFPVLVLPTAVQSLTVEGDAAATHAEASVKLRPLGWRPSKSGSALQAVRYPSASVFMLDANAYPEPTGFWVAGGRSANIVLSDRSDGSTLFVRNAPVENHIRITVDDNTDDLTLAPGEQRSVSLPPTNRSPLLLRITAQSGFRPSTVEPHSTDLRYLGVWVELR